MLSRHHRVIGLLCVSRIFFIYEINFKVFSGHLKQKSSVALQVTGCRSIVAAASGCHQNCLEAMSCVKTIEVIFEESRCHKIYYCFFVTGTCYIHDSTICSSTNEHMCSIPFLIVYFETYYAHLALR